MKTNYFLFILICLITGITSCTKTTNRGIEIEYRVDTVFFGAAAKDTTFVMDTANWSAFNFSTGGLVKPTDTTYTMTSEGIKFTNGNFRSGIRLQTKTELNFRNKTIYIKYKVVSSNQFIIAPMVKYNPLTRDDFPSIQGVHFSSFSLVVQYPETVVIQKNVWHYTKVTPIPGSDNYEAITSTGNYENAGGIVIHKRIIPIYTKSGYICLSFWDNHATDAYAVLGEYKISSK